MKTGRWGGVCVCTSRSDPATWKHCIKTLATLPSLLQRSAILLENHVQEFRQLNSMILQHLSVIGSVCARFLEENWSHHVVKEKSTCRGYFRLSRITRRFSEPWVGSERYVN